MTTRAVMMAVSFAAMGSLLCAAAPSRGIKAEGAFGGGERLLATYFFWRGPWDDTVVTSGRKLGMSGTWKVTYPSPTDPRASIFGLNSATNWPGNALPDTAAWPVTYKNRTQLPLWLMAEWRAMKWSG